MIFSSAFSDGASESEITLEGVAYKAFQMLLDYAYTGQIAISEANVRILLTAATRLEVMEVRDGCVQFLNEQLDTSNCLGIRSFGDKHSCEKLVKTCDGYVVDHFTDVLLSQEFLTLSFGAVHCFFHVSHLSITKKMSTMRS